MAVVDTLEQYLMQLEVTYWKFHM